jgi:formylglycine-generating enzyme required for sulfatase activity
MRRHITLAAAGLMLVGMVFTVGGCNHTKHEDKVNGGRMRLIPAGTFLMGSPDRRSERPVHEVYLDSFYMDECEVTNEQWQRFIQANPEWQKGKISKRYHDGNYLKDWSGSKYPAGKGKHPVVYVSWFAASAYAKWLGKRLPTEAEWEKAARGPRGYKYSYGDRYDATKGNTGGTVGGTIRVASYQPSDYGLYDMTGNVLEWCSDWFGDYYYAGGPKRNPKGPQEGQSRVMRGGSWNYSESRCTTTFRFFPVPPTAHRVCTDFIGFRCTKDSRP